MSEPREQYRDQLAQILDAEYAEAFRTPEERSPWEMVRPEWKQKMGDMAEAVASQVLRDLIDDSREKTHRYPFDVYVTLFADERDISLEDES